MLCCEMICGVSNVRSLCERDKLGKVAPRFLSLLFTSTSENELFVEKENCTSGGKLFQQSCLSSLATCTNDAWLKTKILLMYCKGFISHRYNFRKSNIPTFLSLGCHCQTEQTGISDRLPAGLDTYYQDYHRLCVLFLLDSFISNCYSSFTQ